MNNGIFGFPRSDRRRSLFRRRATLQGNGVSKTFLLPQQASSRYGLTVWTTVSGVLTLRSPNEYAALYGLTIDVTSPSSTMISSTTSVGSAANVVDNSVATSWQGSYASGGQWIGVDFGTPKTITAARWYPMITEGSRYINTFRWEASDDQAVWSTAFASSNSIANAWRDDYWTSIGAFRYWRVYAVSVTTITMAGISEFELYETLDAAALGGIIFTTAPESGAVVIEYMQE